MKSQTPTLDMLVTVMSNTLTTLCGQQARESTPFVDNGISGTLHCVKYATKKDPMYDLDVTIHVDPKWITPEKMVDLVIRLYQGINEGQELYCYGKIPKRGGKRCHLEIGPNESSIVADITYTPKTLSISITDISVPGLYQVQKELIELKQIFKQHTYEAASRLVERFIKKYNCPVHID
ncbi:MAG: hypothetical protein V1859_02770 [archaeon]